MSIWGKANILLKLGIKPRLLIPITKVTIISRLKKATLKRVLRKVRRVVYKNNHQICYRIKKDRSNIVNEKGPVIQAQRYEDILKYLNSSSSMLKQDLTLSSLVCFSRGNIRYSIMKDGKLAHYGWMTKGGRKYSIPPGIGMIFELPPKSIFLDDFYTFPEFRRQGLYLRNLRHIISDSYKTGIEETYISVSQENIASRRAIEKAGFSVFCTFSSKRFFRFPYFSKQVVFADQQEERPLS